MNGMSWFSGEVYQDGTYSGHIEAPQAGTIGQIHASGFSAQTDRPSVVAGLQFRHLEYVLSDGATGSKDLFWHAFAQDGLTRADWWTSTRGVDATFVINLFYWDLVS